ncbi:MAG TPA: ThiF family adenylyltransferase, partial [Tepidisphaeraceae bacterium]|nr:ThiF family adenylyltransferase [Tepidisphaeraceae bacterium]
MSDPCKTANITEVTIDRYHRQTLLPQIGEAGQKRLSASTVLLIGCGALGSTIAEQLARAGIGKIRIADRDIVELTNLQRQVLFDERDAKEGLPKAIAAANRLRAINSDIMIEPQVIDVDADNVEKLCDGV